MTEALSFRQGTVVTWKQATGANTVNIGGTIMTNLPVLTTSEVTSMAAGDVVVIMYALNQYFILGRVDSVGGALNVSAGSAGRGLLGYEFADTALPSAGVTVNVHTSTTLQVTVNTEANRLLRVSLYCSGISTVAGDRVVVAIRDITLTDIPSGYSGPLTIPTGASYDPGFGYVYIQERGVTVQAGPRAQICPIVAYDDRGLAGSRTYQVSVARFSGTGTVRVDADAPGPSVIIVEDVGPLL
jgi:hypothetical protein